MKKECILAGILALTGTLTINAQVTIGKNQAPNPAAVLDLQSKDSLGLLLPVVSLIDTAKSYPLPAKVPGMFVYNTAVNRATGLAEGIYFNDGKDWRQAFGGGDEPWQVTGAPGVKATMNTQNIYQSGQVTVGSDTIVPSAVFNATAQDKGILVPEMTADQRDKIKNPADGLLIYNTTESCFNYWNMTGSVWQSLCGGMAKAVYTVACSDITVNGTYTQGTALNGSNFLSIQADVAKAGNYTITGTTTNGYGFSTQGTFLNEGIQTVLVAGQGQPAKTNPAPGDSVILTFSGAKSKCSNIMIPVLPPTATYSINCGLAKFNGAYVKSKALTATNTVTLSVNVTSADSGHNSWAVFSNTVNGVSFSGSGTFLTTGAQTITLQGTGAPTTTDPITLTFTTNSQDGAATCNATLAIAIPPMKVLGLGDANLGAGNYSVFNTVNANAALSAKADNAKMVYDPNNFGTLDNSTVKFGDGNTTWVVDPNSGYPTATALVNDLTGPTPPDIVVIGYTYDGSAANVTQALATYLQNKGVVLMFCENPAFNLNMMNAVFGGGSITSVPQDGNTAGARYQFPMLNNDPVINGPFGNLGGLYWGEDASTTADIHSVNSNIASQVTIYSAVEGIPVTIGNITAFRHNSLNWIWVGDGGFNSCYDHTSATICPFLVQQTSPYIPIAKQNYSGSNTGMGAGPVNNSIFTANALAWALNQAMANGINSAQR